MLTVSSYIDRSAISGMGLFAAEDLKEGTVIWMYNPKVDLTYSPEEWRKLEEELSHPSYESIKRYSYKEGGKYILCTDNAQFMNHCDTNFNTANSPDLNTMFAIRDIKQGEELLCNYFEYSDSDDHHLKYFLL